jgi:hypothetical protein
MFERCILQEKAKPLSRLLYSSPIQHINTHSAHPIHKGLFLHEVSHHSTPDLAPYNFLLLPKERCYFESVEGLKWDVMAKLT